MSDEIISKEKLEERYKKKKDSCRFDSRITRWDSLAELTMENSKFTQWTPFPKLPEE